MADEEILGCMEIMAVYYVGTGTSALAYLLITTTRFVVVTPEELVLEQNKKSVKPIIINVLRDIAIEAGGVLIHGMDFGLKLIKTWIEAGQKSHQTRKIMDEIRPKLNEIFHEIPLQTILEQAKYSFEIPYSKVHKVEMSRKRTPPGSSPRIKIEAVLKGKTKKFDHIIIAPRVVQERRKTPVMDEEFSKYVELVKTVIQEKLVVSSK